MFLEDHEKTALIYKDEPVTYNDLLLRASAFAEGYRIKKGDRVLLCSENRPEWIYAFYSIWLNRGIPVPLDATAPAEDYHHIIKNCSPAAALCSAACKDKVKQAAAKCRRKVGVISFDTLPQQSRRPVLQIDGGAPGDTAIIMYTSGTTGSPKGVMLSFDNLAASIEGVSSLKMLTPGDSLLGLLPFHHIFPLQGTVIAPLHTGSTIVMVASLSPDEIMAAMQKHRVTIFLGVPKLYALFHAGIMKKIHGSIAARVLFRLARTIGSCRLGAFLFGRVQKAFGGHVHSYLTGGAPMDKGMARDLWALGFRLVEGYGLTETAPLVAFNQKGHLRLGTVGKPLAGTEVMIKDGEILVRGRNVMKGYYRDPQATARKIRDGWFHTGDLGLLDSKGYLTVTGRVDEMIVLPSGKNINPEEIEDRLIAASPYIKEAGVFASGGILTSVVFPDFSALAMNSVVNIAETIKWKVIDAYNTGVPGYRRILKMIISRGELPRTRLGKLKRYLLPQLAEIESYQGPRKQEPSSREYQVLKKFLNNLSHTDVQPDHHLELDLALDSLNRVELLMFIDSAFGVTLTEQDLALNPTPGRLAALITESRTRLNDTTVRWSEILGKAPKYEEPARGHLIGAIRSVAKPLFRLYFRLKYRGIEHLPPGPFILSPNHQSFMDVLLLSIALPDRVLRDTFFIARDSLAKNPVIRRLMRRANVVFVNFEKDLKSAIQSAASLLKAGKNLVIFPEGHRTRDGRIAPFKKTFAILSAELRVPVVPVAIKGAYEALPISTKLPRPGRIELTFCEPTITRGRDYRAAAERIRAIISTIVERA